MKTYAITLPSDLEEYLHDQIARGRFADVADFTRTMLRADRAAFDRLDDLIQDGIDSGESGLSFEDIIGRSKERARSHAA